MEQKITFRVNTDDKNKIFALAREKRMSASTYCRSVVIENLFEQALKGRLNLKDVERFDLNKEGQNN